MVILILETTHKGDYLAYERSDQYKSWINIRDFFGEYAYEHFGKNNISCLRLNKSYEQAIEIASRKNGLSPFVSTVIASYARNHTNINTAAIYLGDHKFSGETAEMALYMAFDCGVMGSYTYKAIMAAFPEQFIKLPRDVKAELISSLKMQPYEIETLSSIKYASAELKEKFCNGYDGCLDILKALYSVGQGFGKAKQNGTYCTKRALGYACAHPFFEKCIAEDCPYLIFTQNGLTPLIEVMSGFRQKYKDTRDQKYAQILLKIIYPKYKEIIKELMSDVSKEEATNIRKALEVINDR